MKKNGTKYLYEIISEYIVEKDCSANDACKRFAMDKNSLYSLLNGNLNGGDIVEQAKCILEKNKYKDLIGYTIYKDMKKNPDCTILELTKKYDKSKSSIKSNLSILKKYNIKIFEESMKIFNNLKLKNKEPKTIKIGKYIVKNSATYNETKTHFKISNTALYSHIMNLHNYDDELSKQAKPLVLSGKNKKRSKIYGSPKYIKQAMYILNNDVDLEETAEYLGITIMHINANKTILKKYRPDLHKLVEAKLQEVKNNKRIKFLKEFAKYVQENDCTAEDLATKYDVMKSTITSRYIYELKKIDKNLAREIKFKLAPKKIDLIVNYILNNDANIEKTVEKFKMSKSYIASHLHALKKSDIKEYNKIHKILYPAV
jgi:hypothetical protein